MGGVLFGPEYLQDRGPRADPHVHNKTRTSFCSGGRVAECHTPLALYSCG